MPESRRSIKFISYEVNTFSCRSAISVFCLESYIDLLGSLYYTFLLESEPSEQNDEQHKQLLRISK